MSDKRRRRRRASGGSSEEDDDESVSGVRKTLLFDCHEDFSWNQFTLWFVSYKVYFTEFLSKIVRGIFRNFHFVWHKKREFNLIISNQCIMHLFSQKIKTGPAAFWIFQTLSLCQKCTFWVQAVVYFVRFELCHLTNCGKIVTKWYLHFALANLGES